MLFGLSVLNAVALGAAVVALFIWQIYVRCFTVKNNSGFPLPPGPKGDPILGHFRVVPLENPEFSYIKWGKEFGK